MYYNQKRTGGRISDLIRSHGMGRDGFAEAVNISVSHLNKVCSGAEGCSIDLLVEIAVYFNVSIDFLILGAERDTTDLKNRILEIIEELAAVAAAL